MNIYFCGDRHRLEVVNATIELYLHFRFRLREYDANAANEFAGAAAAVTLLHADINTRVVDVIDALDALNVLKVLDDGTLPLIIWFSIRWCC